MTAFDDTDFDAAHLTSFSLERPTIVRLAEDSTPRLPVRCKLRKLEDAPSQLCFGILIDYTCHVSSQAKKNEQGIEARQRTDDGRHIESAMGFEKGKVLQMLGTWDTDASTWLNVGLKECASATNVCTALSEIPIQNISTPDNAEHGLHSGYC